MPSYQPPKYATAYILYVSLVDQSNTKVFKSTPTLASGDFKVSIDGGTLNNLATLPTVTPASGKMVKISLSTSEMTGDNITVVCSDASGAEWCDLTINLQTSAQQIDDLATQASVNTIDDFLDTEIGTLTTNVAAILADTGTDGVVVNAAGLAADAVTEIQSGLATAASIAALNDITVADILAGVVEGSITLKGALRLALAVLTGKSSGGDTATIIFRDTGDTKARVTATVDGDGNRSAVTRDITD